MVWCGTVWCSTVRRGTLAYMRNAQLHGCGHGIMNSVCIYVEATALSAIMTLQRAPKELNSGKYIEQTGKRYMCMMATNLLEAGNSWYQELMNCPRAEKEH